MPYGNTVHSQKICQIRVVRDNGYVVQDASMGQYLIRYDSRTGSNRNLTKPFSANKRLPRVVDHYVLKDVTVYNGPRIAKRIWSKRLKRYVWARKPMIVKRLVPVYKKSKVRKKSGLNLLPNSLTFSTCNMKVFGPTSIQVGSKGAYWGATITGDLWTNFLKDTGVFIVNAPDPSQYAGSVVTSRSLSLASSMKTRLLNRLYERVKNQSVNAAQALAERKQTAGMFCDVARRLGHTLLALKHGDLKKAAKHLFPKNSGQVANDWLMIQYGIRPLFSDLDGAAKHLAIPESLTFDVVVADREKYYTFGTKDDSSYIKCTTSTSIEATISVKLKARITVNLSDGKSVGRSLSRLGFGNPASLAWEIIPYSFVADWAIGIGDYLNNMDAFSVVSVDFVTETVFIKEKTQYIRTFGGKDSLGRIWPNLATGFVNERVSCERKILPNVPPLPLPQFKNPLSKGHILNALALLRQLKK